MDGNLLTMIHTLRQLIYDKLAFRQHTAHNLQSGERLRDTEEKREREKEMKEKKYEIRIKAMATTVTTSKKTLH